ncbi:hypothetical protein PENSPDRAFT_734934 [Peniophora sp. CONT]|nr:hypothetical protein PENSPDRAFT_734934 [Peniophora sp. CONT]
MSGCTWGPYVPEKKEKIDDDNGNLFTPAVLFIADGRPSLLSQSTNFDHRPPQAHSTALDLNKPPASRSKHPHKTQHTIKPAPQPSISSTSTSTTDLADRTMKWPNPKSYHIARMGNFIKHMPGISFTYIPYAWLARDPNDTLNYDPAPDQADIPSASVPLVDRAAAIDLELEELNRHQFFDHHIFLKHRSDLLAEKSRIAEEASLPRFTADIQREMRRDNSPYGPNIRGPRPLRRGGAMPYGSAMDIDTSFRREPSIMNVDGPSFYTPQRPQPQRHTYAPTRRGPSVIMEDTSFCRRARAEDARRARKARGEPSIRIEPGKEVDPAVAAQAARDAEETQRIDAEHARRMNEAIQQRIAEEQEAKRVRAEAARVAEAARLAEKARLAEQARLAKLEQDRIAEEKARQERAEKAARHAAAERDAAVKRKAAKEQAQRLAREKAARAQAEADRGGWAKRAAAAQAKLRAEKQALAEQQRLAEEKRTREAEERARAADNGLRARIQRECIAINAERNATIRTYNLYQYKFDLIKEHFEELVAAGIKLDITELPWPIFNPENARTVLNGDEALKAISAFFLDKRRPGRQSKAARRIAAVELKNWHPDKMDLAITSIVNSDQVEECRDLLNIVGGCLNVLYQTN